MTQEFFTRRNGVLYAENVSLEGLADTYGTPTYVYSAAHIRSQYRALADALNGVMPEGREAKIHYACKANSNLAILSLLRQEGCCLETVSEGEFLRGIKAGFDAGDIVSTGIGKTDAELRTQIEAGIGSINVESLEELEAIQDVAQSIDKVARVVFRLNPDVAGGGHDKISTGRKGDKFGILEDEVIKGYARASEMSHVEPLGIMIHIGSQISQVGVFDQAFSKLPKIVQHLRAQGHSVTHLDIGGGFPVRYKDEDLLDLDAYAAWVKDYIAPLDVNIALEPGRYLVANSGILLSRVTYVKESAGHKFLTLDAGMNDLIRPAMYDAYHGITRVSAGDDAVETYDVVGPICESSDIFTRGRQLPVTKRGDVVAFQSAGAYGFCMSSNYNTRPQPVEILIDGDQYAVINARKTYEDLWAGETIPEWL